MSLNLNRVLLAGNLTRDPQVRFLAEKSVAEFGLAINRRFKDANGGQKDDTTFVDVEAWGRTAELAGQYLTKGSGCFVEGRLKLDTWDDKETGQKRSKLRVVADNIQFTDSAKTGATDAAEKSAAGPIKARVKVGMDGNPIAPSAVHTDDEAPFFRSELERLP